MKNVNKSLILFFEHLQQPIKISYQKRPFILLGDLTIFKLLLGNRNFAYLNQNGLIVEQLRADFLRKGSFCE